MPEGIEMLARYAGPAAPFAVLLWIFRKHIRFTFHFDGRDPPEPKKRPPA